MLRRKLKVAFAILGAVTPFAAQADQPMAGGQSAQKPGYVAGEKIRDGQLPGGFSQSANYVIDNGWDAYFTGNYIYYHLGQEDFGMGELVTSTGTGVAGALAGSGYEVALAPSYKSGFQVGLGFDMKGMDDWNLYGEYSWFQDSTTASQAAAAGQYFLLDAGFVPAGFEGSMVNAASMSAEMRYHYNNAELSLERPFYFGKKLTASYGVGLRGLWITEEIEGSASTVSWANANSEVFTSFTGPLSSYRYQKSWGLGPKFMFGSNWLLGCGFRMMGDIGASVLYTRYTDLGKLNAVDTYGRALSQNTLNTMRVVTDASLGLGWGSYFGDDDSFHFDLTASYDFTVLWNQSMMSTLAGGRPSDMLLQGLNVGLRLDF